MTEGNLTRQNVVFPILILLQMISSIWYLLPTVSHAHVPAGFIRMLIFGGIAIVLLVLSTILNFIYRPSELLVKVPVFISIAMLLLAWFYES